MMNKSSENLIQLNQSSILKMMYDIPGNDHCADCNEREPTWASINLGILICLNCSGVHRSLGVHISKVRSLTLDIWDLETLMHMLKLGNAKMNALFEANSSNPGDLIKPTLGSPRTSREAWIIAKYQQKLFLK